MGFLGGLFMLGGLATIAYALFRKIKKNDLAGKPLYMAVGAGMLLLLLGGAIMPGEGGGGKSGAAGAGLIKDINDAMLVSREENGGVMPSPLQETLGEVYGKLQQSMACTVKRNGTKLTISGQNERSQMKIDFTLGNTKDLGKVAIVETLALKTTMSAEPKIAGSAEAHAMLMSMLQ